MYLLPSLFPSLIWKIKTEEKILYLTFDDGPTPEITEWVLGQLKQYNAKATFFCIGKNVAAYPEIYKRIISEGHLTGNHTYNHLNAWKTSKNDYIKDVEKAAPLIESNLFRPPYGKITPALIQSLKSNYKVIMWDVLSYDFDVNKDESYCMNKVIRSAKQGSIVVFHDSVKAMPRLKETLPIILSYLTDAGYQFKTIPVK